VTVKLPSRDSFERPGPDELTAGVIVVGAVVLLVVIGRAFRDVAPA
jgi:hypothetical protein